MENEKDVFLNEETISQSSSDNDVEIEKIIDYYKDVEKDSQPEESDEEERKLDYLKYLNILIKFINKVPRINIPEIKAKEKDSIESVSYGLSEKGKMLAYRLISGVISVAIILISIVLVIYLPGNAQIIEQRAEELRQDEKYVSTKSRYTAIMLEVEELTKSNNQKKAVIDQIKDIDNSKAELRKQINDKKQELNALNLKINDKRATISALDTEIATKTSQQTTRTPGKYTVGKHIAVGKYQVTGTGKFMVADKYGVSKVNIVLGSTPYEVSLQENDIVKFDSKVKFVSIY